MPSRSPEQKRTMDAIAAGWRPSHGDVAKIPVSVARDFVSADKRAGKAQGGQVAKLTTKARKAIAPKNFAGPNKSYPINDPNHARNALARVSQFGSPDLQAKVRAKVHAKYPGIGKKASGGCVGDHDGSSAAMARGGSALSAASVVTAPADEECDDA